MKKFAKILSSALCAVMCIIVLAGCGGKAQLDTEASVSKKGLATSSMADFTTFTDEHTEMDTDLASYRYTVKMKSGGMDMYLNGIAQFDETGKLVATAAKAISKYSTGLITVEVEQQIYLKDGVGYLFMKSGDNEYKYKITIPAEPVADEDGGTSSLNTFTEAGLDLVDLLEEIGRVVDVENVTVTKYENGNIIRYGFEFAEETTTNKYYVEINGNAITGIEIEINTPADETTDTEANYRYAAISPFDGKVEYPSFKGYTEVTEDVLDSLRDML